MINDTSYVVCFGEVLWDIFPEGSRAGGAPFNAAYNIHKMGINAKMLSRIGNDELGKKLTDQIKSWGITTDFIQVDEKHPTSTVIAKIDEHNEATYEIINNVAWDYIELLQEHKDLVSNADVFVFGSLSARNPKTKETLLQLLDYAKLKIFDVNFRPPFIDIELVKTLLEKADIVKMNKAEMRQIMMFLGEEYKSEDESAAFIQNHFKINEIILTKGSKGARYFVGNKNYGFNAIPITIADTVGSGDAFLSGFISKRIKNESPEEIMKQAISLGAFITSKSGACPDYEYSEFVAFRNSH
ncbi:MULTISPECIES: carbohydrate kinase [Chryseobacterium]|uniref:Fructokinase n=1 Tax=Chryseobacterium geocarposphaerae TaxID=1416776 RepID=A0ABU1LFZ2_9FLAO|nr:MULTISPECIES: carbohydrate kinase [Chryseobacterium]MDR6405642.1 fructokinase [Chryseobacterium geocarposphaerae]MDR6698873.1 fructokinase [Chryseobacterium ginsenosidimutans]